MKSWKKFLIVSLSLLFVVTSVFAGLSNFGKTNNNTNKNQSQNQESGVVSPTEPDNTYGGMVYYASEGEETGASEAPRDIKGGAVYVGNGSSFYFDGGTINSHEGFYGGAVYVAKGGTFIMTAGSIEYNYSKYGGAIYVEDGGTCEIKGGNIINNKSENAAIYVEDGGVLKVNTEANITANEYIEFKDTIINFYVDNVCVDSVLQNAPTLNLTKIPLPYEECCGYFFNEEMTIGIEQGDDLTLIDNGNSVQTVTQTGYYVFNLYTKTATLDDFDFEKANDCYYVEIKSESLKEDLVVPKLYNNNPTDIPAYAFSNNTIIKSIYLPSGLSFISEYCFYQSSLEKINIPDSVYTIYDSAFQESSLKEINISKSSKLKNIYETAFEGCVQLTQITLPTSLSYVGHRAFDECTGLERVNIFDINHWINGIEFFQGNSNPLYFGAGLYLNNELVTDIEIVNITEIKGFVFCGYGFLNSFEMDDSVTSIGESAFHNATNLQSINLSSNITYIARAAFNNCQMIQEIVIPSKLTTIYAYTFYSCTNLSNVIFDENAMLIEILNYAFEKCTNLESLQLPSTVLAIGKGTFRKCLNLQNINLSSIETIGDECFKDCENLNSIILTEYLNSLGVASFMNCYNLESVTYNANIESILGASYTRSVFTNAGKNVESIIYINNKMPVYLCANSGFTQIMGSHYEFSQYAFYNCTRLKNLEKVVSAEQYAFYGCSGLTSVSIYGNNISNTAFDGCDNVSSLYINTNLTKSGCFNSFGNNDIGLELEFGESVTDIPNNCFEGVNITKLEFGYNLQSIGEMAFSNCEKLEIITIYPLQNKSVTVGNDAFINSNNILSVNLTDINDYLVLDFGSFESVPLKNNTILYENSNIVKDIVVDESITKINNFAFKQYLQLQSIDLSLNSVISIGESAFSECKTLTKVVLNDALTIIDKYAFNACSNLNDMTWPSADNSSLTNIKYAAFYFCKQLTDIIIPKSINKIGGYAFESCNNVTKIEYYPSSASDVTRGSDPFNNTGSIDGCSLLIKDDVTRIPNSMFTASAITSVSFGSSLREVGAYSFEGCTQLSGGLNFSESLRLIEEMAFAGCYNVEWLYINQETGEPLVQRVIEKYAFYYCNNLETVCVSVSEIQSNAFANCDSITEFDIISIYTWNTDTESYDPVMLKLSIYSSGSLIETIGDYSFDLLDYFKQYYKYTFEMVD